MHKPSGYRFPDLAKVILNIFESKIEPIIGKDALRELRKPYSNRLLLDQMAKAIINAENRFLSENATSEIARALQQLSVADLPGMRSAIWGFFEKPNDLTIQIELDNQIRSILPRDYPGEKIAKAVKVYLHFLMEEMTAFPELKDQWNTLLLYRLERSSEKSADTLVEIRDKLSNLRVQVENVVDATSLAQDFTASVNLFSQNFIGRDFVFDAIDGFISGHKNGYFLIEGDPGVGKSSIIAQLVKNKHCIAHFNNRAIGVTSSQAFLESILSQMVSNLSLPYQDADIHQRMSADGRFLLRLLQESVDRLPADQYILIAVDALDEVETTDQNSANILFLPTQLPERIFFVLSSRRKHVHLVTHAPLLQFDLSSYPEENERDIRVFITLQLGRKERLQNFVAQKQVPETSFVNSLVAKSELNFMYVKSVLTDMENGWYADVGLNELPQGLLKYYEDHWYRMGVFGEIDTQKRRMLRIIYVLAEVLSPVSREQIAGIAEEDELFVQAVLESWLQFLHVEKENDSKFYSIYHNSFRDFLHERDIVSAAGVSIPYINTLIARKFRTDLGF